LAALKEGKIQRSEMDCKGTIFSLTYSPVVESDFVNVYGLDITERKQAEEKLKEYSEHLEEMVGDEEKALAVGCIGYIEKPINPDTFLAEIEKYL